MSSTEIPPHLIDLLERAVFGVLATVSRDESAQASPMWFELIDGAGRTADDLGVRSAYAEACCRAPRRAPTRT